MRQPFETYCVMYNEMGKMQNIYDSPNAGCMLGTAYQVLVGELEDALNEAGINVTAPEYLILRSLYSRTGMQICELAEITGKDKGAVSRCVKGLVAKGLVTTEQISHKCLKVFVSEKGRGIEPTIMEVAKKQHKALASLLTPAEMKIFFSSLKKIIEHK